MTFLLVVWAIISLVWAITGLIVFIHLDNFGAGGEEYTKSLPRRWIVVTGCGPMVWISELIQYLIDVVKDI